MEDSKRVTDWLNERRTKQKSTECRLLHRHVPIAGRQRIAFPQMTQVTEHRSGFPANPAIKLSTAISDIAFRLV